MDDASPASKHLVERFGIASIAFLHAYRLDAGRRRMLDQVPKTDCVGDGWNEWGF
jgi:hypothetical protein